MPQLVGPRISAFSLAVVLNLGYGWIRGTESPARASTSRSLAEAARIWPLHDWGWVFFALGVFLAVCYSSHALLRVAVTASFGMWVWWATLVVETAHKDALASYSGAWLFAVFAAWHVLLLPHRPHRLL